MGEPVDATWSAVVLSGGGGQRLGGADKATLELGGVSLLDRALAAVAGAVETVVVGPPVVTDRPVTFTRERPAGAGPAAALLHGVGSLRTDVSRVVVLAVDMPLVTPATVERLLGALQEAHEVADGLLSDGALLHDGRRQPLCAAYRTTSLAGVDPGPASRPGLSMHALLDGLRLREVPAVGPEAEDVDRWEDLARIRAGHRPPAF